MSFSSAHKNYFHSYLDNTWLAWGVIQEFMYYTTVASNLTLTQSLSLFDFIKQLLLKELSDLYIEAMRLSPLSLAFCRELEMARLVKLQQPK